MSNFKIAAAQVASVRGDIARNIAAHAAAIEAAANHDVSVLVFPELSLTGYEPELAAEVAMEATPSQRVVAEISRAVYDGLMEARAQGRHSACD